MLWRLRNDQEAHRILGGLTGVRQAKEAVKVTAEIVAATPVIGRIATSAGRMVLDVSEGIGGMTSAAISWGSHPLRPSHKPSRFAMTSSRHSFMLSSLYSFFLKKNNPPYRYNLHNMVQTLAICRKGKGKGRGREKISSTIPQLSSRCGTASAFKGVGW